MSRKRSRQRPARLVPSAGARPSAPRAPDAPGLAPSVAAPPAAIRILSGRTPWILAGLLAITAIVYADVRQHDFVSLDDPTYVSANRNVADGLTWPAVKWAFTTGRAGNWHPLTWLSHLLDVRMFGLSAGAHHVTSLVLHVANTLLLFLVLWRMTGATFRSGFVAALFGVHPLHVESVAWIAERKDVLSTLFWMLTLWAYVAYVRSPRWHRYALVLALFALGLMAKPMLVTLPFVLLLLDVWPLQRVTLGAGGDASATLASSLRRTWAGLVREKLPLILLAVASSAVTFVAQRRGGAVSGLDVMPPARRVANALVAYVAYIGKMLWPADLSVFYPYPRSVPVWQVIGALAVLLGASFLVARLARRRPYLAVGWLWYLGTLVPVIGLIQVGTQAMADRYTYVPLIGVFIVIAWGVPDLFARWPRAAWRANAAAAAIAILASAVVARGQAAVWSTSDTLWRHALTVDPANYYAQNAVGRLDAERGRLAEAMTHFAESVRLAPNFPDAYDNLGLALARQGRFAEAIAQYRNALRIDPDSAEAHNNLGAALMKNGKAEEATAQYAEAIRLDPDSATAHNNMGQALAGLGRTADAIAQYEVALRLQPDLADAHDGLGLALASLGRMADAVAQYTEALRLNPASAGTHNNLATALTALGRADEAIAQYTEAIRLDPGNAAVHNNLGFVLAGQGRVAEAIPQFTEAVRLAPDFEMAHLYLGLALAGAGRFDEAAAEFVEVLRLNPNNEGAKRALDTLAKRRAARNTR